MPAKKKSVDTADSRSQAQTAAFEALLETYGKATELLRQREFAGAGALFEQIVAGAREEPELAERARVYGRICRLRLAGEPGDPQQPEARYYRAVVLSNGGRLDDALRLLDGLLHSEPTCLRYLYARASVWALKGAADRAVADLRQAIAVDPHIRYHAVNDPDFERIREEPAFIDIIEPTPTGA